MGDVIATIEERLEHGHGPNVTRSEWRDIKAELASWQARAEAAEKLATHLDQLQSDYAQKYCAETASRLQWQARAEQAEANLESERLRSRMLGVCEGFDASRSTDLEREGKNG